MDARCQNVFQRFNFEFINVEVFYLNEFSDNNKKGCILDVNLEYLEELHNLDNDYISTPKKS